MDQFELLVEAREGKGTSAARRMRRAGKTPAVLYGAGKDVVSLSLNANELRKQLENEVFFSHVLTVKMDGKTEQVVLKALQRDPATSRVLHLDLQRVVATQALTMRVPLHFDNEDKCVGKRAGGVVSRLLTELEVTCLPKDLPEYIAVDLANLVIGQVLHLSELKLPPGVSVAATTQEDPAVVSVQTPAVEAPAEEEGEEALGEAEGTVPGASAEGGE
jgi:large subunit ribosomal protein L25